MSNEKSKDENSNEAVLKAIINWLCCIEEHFKTVQQYLMAQNDILQNIFDYESSIIDHLMKNSKHREVAFECRQYADFVEENIKKTIGSLPPIYKCSRVTELIGERK